MVVDGHAEFVGSDGVKARKAIAEAAAKPKAQVAVSGGDKLTVNVDRVPANADADVLLAITENGLSSDVRKGENSGRPAEPYGRCAASYCVGSNARRFLFGAGKRAGGGGVEAPELAGGCLCAGPKDGAASAKV